MKTFFLIWLLELSLVSGAGAAPRDPVRFAALLEQMRGHYGAMLLNHGEGDHAMALKHSRHPANELYAAAKPDLSPALQKRFEADYARINGVLGAHGSTADLRRAYNTFDADVNAALVSIPASVRQDPRFAARVISAVLDNTKNEYSEGVSGGKVVNLAEYQDAQFYLQGAKRWFSQFRAKFPEHQRSEIASALQKATALYSARGDAGAFSHELEGARTELAEISGDAAPSQASGSAATYFSNIEQLLTRAKASQAAGKADDAEEALIDAYLENYEHLEGPLAAKNKELETRLEKVLREDLRTLLKSGPGAAQFSAAVDAARADLKKARELLE